MWFWRYITLDKKLERETVLEFIGQKYEMPTIEETEQKKQEILSSYDEYQLRKIQYLNNLYDDIETKMPYWSTYNNNLHRLEIAYKKDLMKFTKAEIEGAIRSCIYASDSTRRMMGVFCDLYCEYWVGKEIFSNPCNGISLKKLTQNSPKTLKSKIYGMDEFMILCQAMRTKSNPKHIKPLLLGRYGIIGKQASFMRNLQWRDIDMGEMKVNIYEDFFNKETKETERKFITDLPIDDRFLTMLFELEDVKPEQIIELMKSESYVLDTGAVLHYGTVNSRVNTVCKSVEGGSRISFGDLLFTRQIEMLLKQRKERKINTNDIKQVIKQYSGEKVNSVKVTTLKDRYEDLMGDSVAIYYYTRGEEKTLLELIDPHSREFAQKHAEELNLKID